MHHMTTLYLACQHTQDPLLEVHDGMVAALVMVDHHVIMYPHNHVTPQLQTLLQKTHMAGMEQVKGASHIHHLVPRLCNELTCEK